MQFFDCHVITNRIISSRLLFDNDHIKPHQVGNYDIYYNILLFSKNKKKTHRGVVIYIVSIIMIVK